MFLLALFILLANIYTYIYIHAHTHTHIYIYIGQIPLSDTPKGRELMGILLLFDIYQNGRFYPWEYTNIQKDNTSKAQHKGKTSIQS
jgi:hypothetical protein